jgi:hypothetical protein
MTVSHDVDIVARTIYGEARGESEEGQIAVGFVAFNRSEDAQKTGRRQFGDGSPASACLQPFQFSCWNANDPNAAKLRALDADDPDPVFAKCLRIAEEVLSGQIPDPTNGATFYHTSNISPPWSRGQTPCAEIGRHKFYKGIR